MPMEIKKREKYTGPIRKLDQSAILSHKIKEVSVRTRDSAVRAEHDDTVGQYRSASSFAADRMTDAGVEAAVTSSHSVEQAVARAYRKYGEKKLTGERQAVRMADAEVDRNTAEAMNAAIGQTSEVIKYQDHVQRIVTVNGRKKQVRAVASPKSAVSTERVQRFISPQMIPGNNIIYIHFLEDCF